MKKILFVLLLFGNSGFCQSSFTQVVNVDSTSKEELYNRAKIWISKSFKSANNVIQLDDKENGKIIAKAIISYDSPQLPIGTIFSGYFPFTLTIDIKDNKFRYTFESMTHIAYKSAWSCGSFDNEKPACGTFSCPKKNWDKIRNYGLGEVKSLSNTLVISMNQKKSNEDW